MPPSAGEPDVKRRRRGGRTNKAIQSKLRDHLVSMVWKRRALQRPRGKAHLHRQGCLANATVSQYGYSPAIHVCWHVISATG